MGETSSTVDRALQALSAFTFARPELGVTELAVALGINKSQAHRLLASFVKGGYAVVDPRSHRYRLGPALIRLGMLAQNSGALERAARPFLSDLARTMGESVLLNLAGPDVYSIRLAADGPGPIRFALNQGRQYPWYGGAGGHAIFAFRPDADIEALVLEGFDESTPSGPHDLEQVRSRYRDVRRNGYAASVGEYDARVMSIAAPLRAEHDVVGSVCFIGIPESLAPREAELVPPLLSCAQALSRELTTHHLTSAG